MARRSKGWSNARKVASRKAAKAKRTTKTPRRTGPTAVELSKQLKRRTAELAEARDQQTATAEVLKVISRSAFDLEPVLSTLVASAAKLCCAERGMIFLRIGDAYQMAANYGFSPEFEAFARANPLPATGASTTARAGASGVPVQAVDLLADQTQSELAREYQRFGGHRTNLGVPLRRDGETIGVFTLTRQVVQAFTRHQIELVQTFADQAMIAIENTRLFNETLEALERQTATAHILKVIASSPSDLQPVFEAIAERSNRLLGGHATAVYRFVGDDVHLEAFTSVSAEADAALKASYPRPISGETPFDRVRGGNIAQIVDAFSEDVAAITRNTARARGWRAIIFAPLSGDAGPIGAISVTRSEPGAFAPHHVELLRTFADQAVIAIQNVRLFEQVQQRTRELTQSLNDLRNAQDRLVQTEKLASLGQVTAGIAHEIKNPLNFVNNFSALSTELVDEMSGVLAKAKLDDDNRAELDEIRQLLKSNLEKVVQHGQRADSIVKNMLLHSREGSGEHRLVNINSIVEESLNLAYHGARAEKPGFNVTLQRNFDPTVGIADVYPQEITRVLLNLISNGFYATANRARGAANGFEPTLSAATKSLGDKIEIRIRDNGTGIPADVKARIFTPFFTTKPPGEGTGLGLSMSYDIIVKQHRGAIDIETELGAFTEFIITLPRGGASPDSKLDDR
jgi:two-component system NtrC family sensor kinase